jgi:hypothetical protein
MARPRASVSPSRASLTSIWQISFRRFANARENTAITASTCSSTAGNSAHSLCQLDSK